MSQELPFQWLLEEFGGAFNVKGLAVMQFTWEEKGRILEGIVERAKWWLGLGHRSQEPQNYSQAVMGVREIIAANVNDSRFMNLPTQLALDISCSFFDKVCSLVDENERRNSVAKGLQKKTSGQRRLLPAPASTVQLSASSYFVPADSSQPTPSCLQEAVQCVKRSSLDALSSATSASINGARSSENRKASVGSAVAKQGVKSKGKERAEPVDEAGAGSTRSTKPHTTGPTGLNLSRRISVQANIGGAGPSTWNSELKESGREQNPLQHNGLTGCASNSSASCQQNPRAPSQKTENFVSKIHSQFLNRIRKAKRTALTPSQRVQLNLCISQANHLEGVPSIPLISNSPRLQWDTTSSAHALAANLVRDCQYAVSLAAPRLATSISTIPADSIRVSSGTPDSSTSKRAKLHKRLCEPSGEHQQDAPPPIKSKSDALTKMGTSTDVTGTYIHAAASEVGNHPATLSTLQAVPGDDRSPSSRGEKQLMPRPFQPLPTNASQQMLSPNVPQPPPMASTAPPRSQPVMRNSVEGNTSGRKRRSPSHSIPQPAAKRQANHKWSSSTAIPISTVSSPALLVARRPPDDIVFSAQILQVQSDLSSLPSLHQPQQISPNDSTNFIYNTVHSNPAPVATSSSLIGNQDTGISDNNYLLNSYDEQAFFRQYLNIPIEEYIGDQELQAPQILLESGNQMGPRMEQLRPTMSPTYGQQIGDISQCHFRAMPHQGGTHMSYISMTGHRLIPPYQPQQELQWSMGGAQAYLPDPEGDSDQNPITLN